MTNKKEIRSFINEKRFLLEGKEKESYDKLIFNKLIKSEEYIKSEHIFIYVSFNNEVDTHRIIQYALKDNKHVYVPKVISKEEGMKGVAIESIEELKKGSYGILEPESFQASVKEDKIDLVIIPGVAFDLSGGRLGYGGGFYDRFLVKLKHEALKLALAYDFQIINKVPTENHDIRMHRIITN